MKTIDESYFKEPMNANTIEDILEEDEKILWRSRPKAKSYIASAFCRMLPIALVWLIIDGGFIGVMIGTGIISEIWFFIIPFFLLHLFPVWLWIANSIKAKLEVKNIEYVFTRKRIILRTGVVGIDYKFIYYDKIENVNVKVGLIDKLNHVGDIYITAAGSAGVLFDQESPYQLATKLQKIAHDIKTDISFPNALRPDCNPGYNTDYAVSEFGGGASSVTEGSETAEAPKETTADGARSAADAPKETAKDGAKSGSEEPKDIL